MRRALLTGRTVRLFSQAGEGLGGLWWSCGPLSPRVFRCLPSRVHPIREHQLPEQREEQKLVEKWGAYHGIPFLCRSNGGMLPVFRANELSAGWRYTTVFGETAKTRATARIPNPAANPPTTQTSTSGGTRLPCRGVAWVSRKYCWQLRPW